MKRYKFIITVDTLNEADYDVLSNACCEAEHMMADYLCAEGIMVEETDSYYKSSNTKGQLPS